MTKLIIDLKKGGAKKFKKHLEEEHPNIRGKIKIVDEEEKEPRSLGDLID